MLELSCAFMNFTVHKILNKKSYKDISFLNAGCDLYFSFIVNTYEWLNQFLFISKDRNIIELAQYSAPTRYNCML